VSDFRWAAEPPAFDASLAQFKDWFIALPISRQSHVLETLECANDVDAQPGAGEAYYGEGLPV
jgi:hypothetical protein